MRNTPRLAATAPNRGFTLIELLVVIAIIGLLSAVVLASLNNARSKGRDAQRLSEITELRSALELYASSNNGAYPISLGGGWSNSTFTPPGTPWIPGLSPTYIASVPIDPINQAASSTGDQAFFYISSDGVGYCIQVTQENSPNCVKSPYYRYITDGTCKLGYGTGGLGPTSYCRTH